MSSEKYIGLDVHQATISVAVMDSQGKVVMESILETKASTLLEFLAGLRGSLFVTFEEGCGSPKLYATSLSGPCNIVTSRSDVKPGAVSHLLDVADCKGSQARWHFGERQSISGTAFFVFRDAFFM